MPIFSAELPPGRPPSRTDFVAWWLPEFAASAGCICAGLTLWGPLAALAVIPALRPAVEAAQLLGEARLKARGRLDAATAADGSPTSPTIVVTSERLDRARDQVGALTRLTARVADECGKEVDQMTDIRRCEGCGGDINDMPGYTYCSAQCAEAAAQQAEVSQA